MKTITIQPTGRESPFGEDEIIVSKTDTRGVITYANEVFLRVSGYTEDELLGQPHNIIRHPEMPHCVFDLLWKTLESGHEIFAYVLNLAKNGDHYWVFAHVTPTFNASGEIIGYHSNRRKPKSRGVKVFAGLYRKLLIEEQRHSGWRQGMAAASRVLGQALAEKHMSYDEFVFSV